MSEQLSKFQEYLQSQRLKLTRSRKLVLEAAFSLHEHFDAESLHERIKGLNVSLATVYRTLPLLQEAGLVQLALRKDGRDFFEHILGHPKHLHWLCESCQRVYETELEELIPILENKAKSQRFTINTINIHISGICWKCRKNENDSQ
ncbi:MAG: Fur family transcriptional regulator [Candidatus Cloacimonetes bacterium]|nr:Fur family transcriptional regulator [Candidatus Cloacimonadota bacterium]